MSVDAIKDPRQLKALQEYLKKNPRDALLFNFSLHTGLKIADIINLKIKDVINAQGKIKTSIYVKVNGFTRKVHLPSSLRKYLLTYITHHYVGSRGFLFLGVKGDRPLTILQANRQLKMAAEMVGIENFGSNTARKTWAYMTYKKDESKLDFITEFFGQNTRKNTLKYIGEE